MQDLFGSGPVAWVLATLTIGSLFMLYRTVRRLWMQLSTATVTTATITRHGDTLVVRMLPEDQASLAVDAAERAFRRGARNWLGEALKSLRREVVTDGDSAATWLVAEVDLPDGSTIGGEL